MRPRSPREEAGPLKGSPVSVRLRPGVLINGTRRLSIANAVSAETIIPEISQAGGKCPLCPHRNTVSLNPDISVLVYRGQYVTDKRAVYRPLKPAIRRLVVLLRSWYAAVAPETCSPAR